MHRTLAVLTVALILATQLSAQDKAAIAVNVDNFCRAESDTYFARFVKEGGLGKFHHDRELASIENQTVIRLNRDTLYSFAVVDLDASPATVKLPKAEGRFMSLMLVNQDHYVPQVVYEPGVHRITRERIGTRYACLGVRIFVNPGSPDDIKAVHSLQDAIEIEQKAIGKFGIPAWDEPTQKRIRDALLNLTEANGGLDSSRMFGTKDQVDPVQHLLGTAAGWGGNPRNDAYYAGAVPSKNDGKTAYQLTLKEVPVDGFWSVSVYNKDGYFTRNALNAYTLNNVTAKPNADGSVTVRFGGDEKAENYLPITPGWNYLLRFYRPRTAILDGTWKVPEAVLADN